MWLVHAHHCAHEGKASLASIDGLRKHGMHPATAGCSRMSGVDLAAALAAALAALQSPAQLASRRGQQAVPNPRFPAVDRDAPTASTALAGKPESEVRAHA
jgi:hypothetical protein